jgi:hypothetical protein
MASTLTAYSSGLMRAGLSESRALRLTAHALARDVATAEVVEALRAAGVRSIVLKGPSIARWLYADGQPRPYGDTDLLVSPADLDIGNLENLPKSRTNAGKRQVSKAGRRVK